MRTETYKLALLIVLLCSVIVLSATEFRDGVVYYDGKVFFPFGVWDVRNDYQGAVDAGLNCFLFSARWDDINHTQNVLDSAEKYGLKAIVYFHYDQLKHIDSVIETVKRFKDHSAVLAWDIGDDMKLPDLPRVVRVSKVIKAIDKSHPVIGDVVHAGNTPMDSWQRFKPHLDIMMQYDYPIGLGGPPNWRNFDQHRSFIGFCLSRCGPTLWTFTQAFTWISTLRKLDLPAPDDMEKPYPEPSQLRLLTYIEIECGEKGLLYFGPWHRIKKNPASVCEIALLSYELSPCFELFAKGKRITNLKTNYKAIKAVLWKYKDKYAVLVHRERPFFHRYVDSSILKNVYIELPISKNKISGFAVVRLGIEPAIVKLLKRDNKTILQISQLEISSACILTKNKTEVEAIKTRPLPPKVKELILLAGRYQLNKVESVYRQCNLNLPKVDKLFNTARWELSRIEQNFCSNDLLTTIMKVKRVYRLARQAVEVVMKQSEQIKPVSKRAEKYRGLYYGMPNFFKYSSIAK